MSCHVAHILNNCSFTICTRLDGIPTQANSWIGSYITSKVFRDLRIVPWVNSTSWLQGLWVSAWRTSQTIPPGPTQTAQFLTGTGTVIPSLILWKILRIPYLWLCFHQRVHQLKGNKHIPHKSWTHPLINIFIYIKGWFSTSWMEWWRDIKTLNPLLKAVPSACN